MKRERCCASLTKFLLIRSENEFENERIFLLNKKMFQRQIEHILGICWRMTILENNNWISNQVRKCSQRKSCLVAEFRYKNNKKDFCFLRLKRAGNVLRFHNEEIRALESDSSCVCPPSNWSNLSLENINQSLKFHFEINFMWYKNWCVRCKKVSWFFWRRWKWKFFAIFFIKINPYRLSLCCND